LGVSKIFNFFKIKFNFFLLENNTGKTTFIKKLMKEENTMMKSEGLNIYKYNSEGSSFNIWDFNGNQEYQLLQSSFFPSKQNIILLFFDCSLDDIIGQNDLLYWFSYIRSLKKNSHLLLIATKLDLLQDKVYSFWSSTNSRTRDALIVINSSNFKNFYFIFNKFTFY
jgi:GTPase SAR1 family protein